MRKAKMFLFLLPILVLGITGGEAGNSENTPSRELLVAKAPGSPPPTSPHQRITLAPFYLIQEQGAKAWIERVIVTVEVDHSRQEAAAFNHPLQRSRLFEILISESERGALPAKVQAALNQILGEPAVLSVHLSQSYLLF